METEDPNDGHIQRKCRGFRNALTLYVASEPFNSGTCTLMSQMPELDKCSQYERTN